MLGETICSLVTLGTQRGMEPLIDKFADSNELIQQPTTSCSGLSCDIRLN
jgi:hypothetical protein